MAKTGREKFGENGPLTFLLTATRAEKRAWNKLKKRPANSAKKKAKAKTQKAANTSITCESSGWSAVLMQTICVCEPLEKHTCLGACSKCYRAITPAEHRVALV